MPNFVGDALMAHAKAGCYRCERGDVLVDMDTLIEGEGALVLCVHCIGEAAEAAGMHLNAAAVAEMRAAHAEERRTFGPDRIAALEAELAEAKAALAAALDVERLLSDIAVAARGPQVNRRPQR